jgi:hypothetical protein
MITFEEGTINKDMLIEHTKNIIGIRYKTNKDGSFEVYTNGWTMIVDLIKKIKK